MMYLKVFRRNVKKYLEEIDALKSLDVEGIKSFYLGECKRLGVDPETRYYNPMRDLEEYRAMKIQTLQMCIEDACRVYIEHLDSEESKEKK